MDVGTILTWIVLAILLLIWIWAIYDLLFVSSLSPGQKIFWLIMMILFSYVGIIFYYLSGRKESEYKIMKR